MLLHTWIKDPHVQENNSHSFSFYTHTCVEILALSPYYLYGVWHAAKVASGAGIVAHMKDEDIHISFSVNADI